MQKQETMAFQCDKLGGAATIVLTYVTRPREPEFPRILSGFDCKHRNECGVGTQSSNGLSWTYDWKSCVHPDAPKQG